MVNRTNQPIRLLDYDNYVEEKAETKALQTAYFGDGNGNFTVPSTGANTDGYGKCYIRFPQGVNSDGSAGYSQPVEAYLKANIPYEIDFPIKVYKDRPSQTWVIDDYDFLRVNTSGYDTRQLNLHAPEQRLLWLRQMQDGNAFATATATTDATTISIQPFTFFYDGSIYDGNKKNNVDLSSYIPSAGNERLVLVGMRPYDRTVQIVSGSTRTITSTKYALSDIATLIAQFDDYIIPLRAVKLADGASTVLEKNLHQDLRQFINVQQPRGIQNPVTRHRYIASGYQETIHGKLYISTGKYELAGKLVMRD